MKRIYKKLLFLLIYLVIFSSVILFSQLLNTGFTKINVQSVTFSKSDISVNGYLYNPLDFETSNNLPAVILVHGIMNAKETMSGIALELARSGIVAITIDALGHGNSIEKLDDDSDPSLGVIATIDFLESLSYVNSSNIGLVGHSMGVGAIRAASLIKGNIKAHIFIGGLSIGANTSVYGNLNSVSPSNLLVAIGKYDETFDIEEVKEELKPVFGTTELVQEDTLYGDFSNLTARKLIIPKTTHLFEPINRKLVKEAVNWMIEALDFGNIKKGILFPLRDLFMTIGFFAFVGIVFFISEIAFDITFFRKITIHEEKVELTFSFWKMGLSWGVLHLVLFAPPILLFGMGSVLIPLTLGITAISWVLSLAIIGCIFAYYNGKKKHPDRNFKEIIKGIGRNFIYWRGLILAVDIFLLLVIFNLTIELIPGISMKFIVPLLSNFNWLRALMFLILVPFMFAYFTMDGLVFTSIYNERKREENTKNKLIASAQVVGIKLLPFILVLLIQYLTMVIFNFKILTGFLGFSMQFLIMLLPLFLIYTVITIWFFERTSSVETGALLNALLFAWTLATLLPIS
ncbi:MAG: alpha/beta hydrolase [Candidatus Thorarchaeota archaeon]